MKQKAKLYLQKCLYFNGYAYIVWIFTEMFFFYVKSDEFDVLIKYLSLIVFLIFSFIEPIRIYYLGYIGNLQCKVPELATFLMLSIFVQLPLITYFLFNTYLINKPVEIILHTVLWIAILLEICLSLQTLKEASSIAKSIYLSSTRTRIQ